MKLKKMIMCSFLTIICSFLGLFFSNVNALSPIRVDTHLVDRGIIELSEGETVAWRRENLNLSENHVRVLRFMDRKSICVSSPLCKIICELCSQIIDMDVEADAVLQMYQEGEISDEYLEKYSQKIEFSRRQLDIKIVDSLIKFKDQCL